MKNRGLICGERHNLMQRRQRRLVVNGCVVERRWRRLLIKRTIGYFFYPTTAIDLMPNGRCLVTIRGRLTLPVRFLILKIHQSNFIVATLWLLFRLARRPKDARQPARGGPMRWSHGSQRLP